MTTAATMSDGNSGNNYEHHDCAPAVASSRRCRYSLQLAACMLVLLPPPSSSHNFFVSSFTVSPSIVTPTKFTRATKLFSDNLEEEDYEKYTQQYYNDQQQQQNQQQQDQQQQDQDEEEPQGLVLDGLDQQMRQMSSKYGFTESDFLAAARKRAEERVESVNSMSTDEDWQKIAEAKKKEQGDIDDWENSLKEAGNTDSQILMFTDPPPGGEDGEDGDSGEEPKLLLF